MITKKFVKHNFEAFHKDKCSTEMEKECSTSNEKSCENVNEKVCKEVIILIFIIY